MDNLKRLSFKLITHTERPRQPRDKGFRRHLFVTVDMFTVIGRTFSAPAVFTITDFCVLPSDAWRISSLGQSLVMLRLGAVICSLHRGK